MSAIWIKELNKSNSRLVKENVIKKALTAALLGNKNADFFLRMFNLCYNSFITFGVRHVNDTVGITGAPNPWEEFSELCITLADRGLTGNDAKTAIEGLSEEFDSEEWNLFLAPVLRRDLRAGVSEKTFNKICKGTVYEIPIFECQLATNCEGRPEMKGIKRLEKKLDGVRVLMKVEIREKMDGPVVYIESLSRNGKIFENFGHIENQLRDIALQCYESTQPNWLNNINKSSFGVSFIFDGEVVGKSFQELMRQARRKEDVQADDSVFHIFDWLPYDAFKKGGEFNTPLKTRMKELEKLRPLIDTKPNLSLLDHVIVDLDTDKGVKQFEKYASDMVAAGFEGIMIKDLSSLYECKRSTAWMKYKPVYDYDLKVIAVEEGNGKHAGRMGALVCEGIDDGKLIKVNVGSGYTDTEREDYWNNREHVVGQTAVVLADAITQNRDGTYSLRFPRFKCFREDK
jgi:DNA ligase 1